MDRTEVLTRAREFIRAHGQVPRTEGLPLNPDQAAWQLLEQVLIVAEAHERLADLERRSADST
jgi:hypothetical protein